MDQIFKLENQVQHYPWGSPTWIPDLLGVPNPHAEPWAELWMGIHPNAPSAVRNVESGTRFLLGDLIQRDRNFFLGSWVSSTFGSLPFLFKLLAAQRPLSIQAHPTLEQARLGWERENQRGIPLSSERRNYKDPNHKPEIICALEPFRALCGFRRPDQIGKLLDILGAPTLKGPRLALERGSETEALRFFLQSLLNLSESDKAGLTDWIERLDKNLQSPHGGGPWKEYQREGELMVQLARQYPSDPSVIAPLYLNLIDLKPLQALYLPAGQLHGYVEGFGVELMANSDNVLRGGLTSKYVDVPELLSILDFSPLNPSILEVPSEVGTLISYPTAVREFSLHVVRGNGKPISLEPGAPRILVLTQGNMEIYDGTGKTTALRRGESVFIAAEATNIQLSGTFTAFVASVGRLP